MQSTPALNDCGHPTQKRDDTMKNLIAAVLATTALTGAAFADDTINEFRIGILGGENAQDRMNSYSCLQDYTTELLGVETKLFAPADYAGVIQGLVGGTLDMAWLGASSYASTYLQDNDAVEPVLVKVNLDGSYGYHSIGFARKDSGITKIEELEGKSFGFGDPNSTSGYLIPSIEIPAQYDVTMESGDFFGEVKFTGGHEQTIVAVTNGDIDAGVTWADAQGDWEDGYNSGALRKAVDAGLVDMNDLVQIWKSNTIPEGPMVLRTSLPADVKAKMTALLQGMNEVDADCTYAIAAGETLGFQPITHDAYLSVIGAREAKNKAQ
jgi:phosphonate transport system substrate-binding protein